MRADCPLSPACNATATRGPALLVWLTDLEVPTLIGEPASEGTSPASLPLLCESRFLCPAQRFHGIFQARCRRSTVRRRECDQFGRPVGADIRRPLSGIVDLEAFFNIGRDPGVEASVRAPEHVNEPRFGNGLRHYVAGNLYHQDNSGRRDRCSVADARSDQL